MRRKEAALKHRRPSGVRASFVTLTLQPVSVNPYAVSDELVNSLADILADALVSDILRYPVQPDHHP